MADTTSDLRIYTGESVPGTPLTQGAVFNGDFPVHIAAILEARPVLKSFFAPVGRFVVETKKNGVTIGRKEIALAPKK